MDRRARGAGVAGAMERWSGLPAQDNSRRRCAPIPASPTRPSSTKARRSRRAADAKTLSATYFWPMQSHGSIGPSCAVADVSDNAATIWTASQGTHGNQATFARFLGLPQEKCG